MRIFITVFLLSGILYSQVPNTSTFTFQNVKNSVENNPNDLIEAFENATDIYFDPAYKGSKNSLLNFRNYKMLYEVLCSSSSSDRESRCGQFLGYAIYSYSSSPSFSPGDRVYAINGEEVVPVVGVNNYILTEKLSSKQVIQIDPDGYISSVYICP